MMQITQSSDITPAVLTEVLAKQGVLHSGRVTEVTLEMESSQNGMEHSVAAFNDLACADITREVQPAR